jgi:hypothetical protein
MVFDVKRRMSVKEIASWFYALNDSLSARVRTSAGRT